LAAPGTPSSSLPKPGPPEPAEPRPLPAPRQESGYEAAAVPRQEDAYIPLFEAADTIAAATAALVDLLTDLVDPETKAKQLAELEHEEDVGAMVYLHSITEPLDPVADQARVLLRAAEHTSQGMR
jgi:hypothetical protein